MYPNETVGSINIFYKHWRVWRVYNAGIQSTSDPSVFKFKVQFNWETPRADKTEQKTLHEEHGNSKDLQDIDE